MQLINDGASIEFYLLPYVIDLRIDLEILAGITASHEREDSKVRRTRGVRYQRKPEYEKNFKKFEHSFFLEKGLFCLFFGFHEAQSIWIDAHGMMQKKKGNTL